VCAHAVRVAITRVPGVTDVKVSLQSATTTIDLTERNTVTLDEIRDLIKKSGFKPGTAEIKGSGLLVEEAGRLLIDLRPARARWPVISKSDPLAAEMRRVARAGAEVDVSGTVADTNVLTVKEVKSR
jgi:copper chaperone CopZ